MKRPFKKERLKTILIVVLFMLTILLLYFLWKGNLSGDIRLPIDFLTQEEEVIVPEIGDIMIPERIVVSFGGDSHTMLTEKQNNRWDELVAEFAKFNEAGGITIKEITKAQYDEAVKVRSIRAEFNYWMPFSETLIQFNIGLGADYSKIEAFSLVAYSTAIPESILIYDGKNKKYYRLVAESDRTNLSTIIDEVETSQFDSYFPMRIYLGIDNSALMPIAMKASMGEIPWDSEIKYYEEDKIVEFAKKFFGEGFDFVRKITENNGTMIYMYGYGEKSLIISKEGAIEYKQELDDSAVAQPKYYDALDTALKFVTSHGGWSSMTGSELTPYLKKVTEIKEDSGKGYKFDFGMLINGTPLYYTNNAEILGVGVTGGGVSYFKRQMIDIGDEAVRNMAGLPQKDTMDPINILTENYKDIKTILNKNSIIVAGETDTETFENLAALIDRIETGYVRQGALENNQPGRIYPAWVFSIGKIDIFFDIYTGEFLGTSGGVQGGS